MGTLVQPQWLMDFVSIKREPDTCCGGPEGKLEESYEAAILLRISLVFAWEKLRENEILNSWPRDLFSCICLQRGTSEAPRHAGM